MLTTHDLNGIATHLPHLVCLNTEVIGEGTPREVLTADILERTYGARMEILEHAGMPVVLDHVHHGRRPTTTTSRGADVGELLRPFEFEFFRNGLVVATFAGALCGLVGVIVVLKGMSYIGHGLSHAIFGGYAASALLGVNFVLGAGAVGHRVGADDQRRHPPAGHRRRRRHRRHHHRVVRARPRAVRRVRRGAAAASTPRCSAASSA